MDRRRTVVAALALGLALRAATAAAADGPSASDAVAARPEFKGFQVVFVENDLRTPGLAVSDERDERLVDYKYFELGRVLRERGPLVLAANGLAGDVTVLSQPKAGDPVEIAIPNADEPTLLLRVRSVRQTRTGILRRAYVEVVATLIGRPVPAANRETLWSSVVTIRLGADEAMGVLLTHRVDAERVDSLLVGLLNGMAAKGLVALPQGKAARPKAS